MIVHELKNDVSTVRIHDEFYDSNATRLIGSVSRVVSESYKRRYLTGQKEHSGVDAKTEHQPLVTMLRL